MALAISLIGNILGGLATIEYRTYDGIQQLRAYSKGCKSTNDGVWKVCDSEFNLVQKGCLILGFAKDAPGNSHEVTLNVTGDKVEGCVRRVAGTSTEPVTYVGSIIDSDKFHVAAKALDFSQELTFERQRQLERWCQ